MSGRASRVDAGNERAGAAKLAVLSLAGFFMYGCNSILMTVLPSYVLFLGYGTAEAGIQGSVFLIAAVLIRFAAGPLSTWLGNKTPMAVGAASFALSAALLCLTTAFWQILLVRCVQAIGLALFWPCATAFVALLAPQGKAGGYVGAYRFATAASLLVGPAVAIAATGDGGYPACFLALAAVCALSLVLVLCAPTPAKARPHTASKPSSNAPSHAPSHSPAAVGGPGGRRRAAACRSSANRRLAVLLAATTAASTGYGLVMGYVVVFVGGVDPGLNSGLFFTFFGMGGLIANPLVGVASDRRGGRVLPFAMTACMGLGVLLVPCVRIHTWLLFAAGFASGFGSSGTTVSVVASIAKSYGEDRLPLALSLQQNTVDVGIAAASGGFGVVLAALPSADLAFIGQGAAMVACSLCLCPLFLRLGGDARR